MIPIDFGHLLSWPITKQHVASFERHLLGIGVPILGFWALGP